MTWLPALLGAGAVGLGAYAVAVEPYRPRIRRETVPVPATWPALSILHLSDIHVGRGRTRQLKAQVARLRGLEPDLLCLTGDLCETRRDVPNLLRLLGEVRPRLGAYAVLGNHEYGVYLPARERARHMITGGPTTLGVPAGAQLPVDAEDDPPEFSAAGWARRLPVRLPAHSSGAAEARIVASALADAGITVLLNDAIPVTQGGHAVWVVGVDSSWAALANPARAFHAVPAGAPTLALVHEPELAPDCLDRGATLALAGHTHGGQFRLPFVDYPFKLAGLGAVPKGAGLQVLNGGYVNVSAGFGQGLPFRLGRPPEAVWLNCVPAV